MNQMISMNPVLAGNPSLQEQMRNSIPLMTQQLNSPEFQAIISNPQALEALLQIQRGMDQLQRVAPNLIQNSTGGIL